MGGDVMYAAGVQDQPNRYTFSYSWSAARTAPTASTTITIFVRQGSNVVRLPLTLNVIAPRAPTGSSLVPATPVVTGSGGPYCVWQYKLFGDPPPCWHLAAASCSEPRYANRPEYVLVGSNMRRSEADKRVGDLSRYFNDNACRASTTTDYPPFDTDPGVVASTPTNLQAELTCDGQLELVAGSRPESCGVRVRGWRSTTSTPVTVRIEPPISPASGIRVSPGNTSQSGDTMYAAGVSDRANEYVFSEFWSVERGGADKLEHHGHRRQSGQCARAIAHHRQRCATWHADRQYPRAADAKRHGIGRAVLRVAVQTLWRSCWLLAPRRRGLHRAALCGTPRVLDGRQQHDAW